MQIPESAPAIPPITTYLASDPSNLTDSYLKFMRANYPSAPFQPFYGENVQAILFAEKTSEPNKADLERKQQCRLAVGSLAFSQIRNSEDARPHFEILSTNLMRIFLGLNKPSDFFSFKTEYDEALTFLKEYLQLSIIGDTDELKVICKHDPSQAKNAYPEAINKFKFYQTLLRHINSIELLKLGLESVSRTISIEAMKKLSPHQLHQLYHLLSEEGGYLTTNEDEINEINQTIIRLHAMYFLLGEHEITSPTSSNMLVEQIQKLGKRPRLSCPSIQIIGGEFQNYFDGHLKNGTQVSAYSGKCQRPQNQDRIIINPPNNTLAVIDGMGGHKGGMEAAVKLANSLIDNPFNIAQDFGEAILELKEKDFFEAGAVVSQIIFLNKKEILINHCGDTKVMITRGDKTIYATTDHNGQGMVLSCCMTPRKQIYQVTTNGQIVNQVFCGQKTPKFSHNPGLSVIVSTKVQVEPGDVIILSSDGLTANVHQLEIAHIIATSPSLELARIRLGLIAEMIMKTKYGNPDNLSVILAKIPDSKPFNPDFSDSQDIF